MAINRYQLSSAVKRGQLVALAIQGLLKVPERLLGMILVGNMFTNNLATMIVTSYFSIHYPEWSLAIAFTVLTLIQLVFCEILPKTVAATYPYQLSMVVVYPLKLVMRLLSPLVWALSLITKGILSCFGLYDNAKSNVELTVDELKGLVSIGGRELPTENRYMLLNILDMESVFVEDVMLPKHRMLLVDIATPLKTIEKRLQSSESNYALFYCNSLDNVLGVLLVVDYFKLLASEKLTHQKIRMILEQVHYIPGGSLLSKQLKAYENYSHWFSLVVDEYGQLLGLLTRDEVAQFVIGHSIGQSRLDKVTKLSKRELVVAGDVPVRTINQLLAVEMTTDGPVTLSGLVVEHLECLPDGPISVRLNDVLVEVLSIDNNVIVQLRVTSLV